ncbi:pilus assembly protein [Neisseria flava]|jgi:putative membrane protein|uniref:pilus assembly PilX family protein n=1 Tax=Neisseria sicca TaxID=490 RepID=UPI0008A19AF5|nr:pilus assembly protein [Neisseria sicca]MBY6282729.1 pilus assembly protein [Neisseria flava]OFJ87938.1 pilus assembly protein PilX [Neisseria sp. HMSC072F04]QTM23767.1 pilus assembly protein [Neisseria sicca]
MRRPITLNHPAKASAQKGFALFIVLMIMIVIALLVVTATQSYNTEQRISTNDADHKFATTLAEAALREGENHIYEIEDGKKPFTDDCAEGLCKAANVTAGTYTIASGTITVSGSSKDEAWIREDNKKETKYIDINGIKYPGVNSGAKKDARYIIEYLSTNSTDNRTIYRVTAKAWGENENTVVILQSYVANE